MSALGRLVASVVLDTAEFTVGTDKAAQLAGKMATSIDRQMRDLESNVKGTMGGIAAAIAAGWGVNALKGAFDDLVRFRGELEKTKVVTGASVENLSILAQAAKLAGRDFGTVEQALVKMTKGLTASNADTKDTARALDYLGVAGKDAAGKLRDPGEVMIDVAKAMGRMEDGANKTALATALWGKAGAQNLPILKELAENGDLVAKVTQEQADQAREYEKAMVRLGIAMGSTKKSILQEFVEPATAMIQVITDSMTATDGLSASVKKMGEAGELKTFAEQGAYALASLIDYAAMTGKTIMAIGGSVASVIADINALGEAVKLVKGQGTIGQLSAALDARAAMSDSATARWKALGEMNATAYRDGFTKKLAENAVIAGFGATSGSNSGRPGFVGTSGDGTAARNAEAEALRAAKKALDEYVKAAMDAIAADEEMAKGLAAIEDKQTAAILGTEKQIENIQFETSIMGLSNDERTKAIALRTLETSGIDKQSTAYATLKGRLTDALAQQAEQHAQLEATRLAAATQVSTWNDLASVVIDTFHRGKDALKDFLRSMLELFARKYILQIGAAMTGSTALSAAANTMGQGSAASSAGSLLGLGVSGFGSLAGAGGGALTGGAMGGFLNGAEVFGSSLMSGSGAGMLSGASGMLAAAGPYIAFAAVAYGLYKAFAAKAGGPKEGGSYQGMFNDVGAMNSGSSPGWYGVSTQNANVQSLVGSTGLTLAQSIARYGGTTSGFSIGLGYDADPRGTANSRLTSSLTDASGKTIFGHSGMDIGRGNEGAALSLEMSRLIVEGLKASNINEEVKKLFDGFTGTTQEAFDALFASAEDLNGALTTMANVTIGGLTVDALKQMALAGETLSQTAARVAGNFTALQDLFSTDAEKRARDEKAIADAFAAINVAMPDSIAGFKALIDGLDLSTESGRALYDVLVATGPKFKQLMDDVGAGIDTVTTAAVTAYTTMISLNDLSGINIHTPGSTIPGAGGSSINDARQNLADQLRGALVSDASPYTLRQRYETAKAQFNENLARAQGGDESAINSAFGLFQTFTSLSQQVNASSGQYNTDYFGGLNALGGLTQGAARPFTAADYTAGNAQVVQALATVFSGQAAQTAALIENANDINAETKALLERIATATEKPASPGALTPTTL